MAGEEYIADRLSLFYDDVASGRDSGLMRPDMPSDYANGAYQPFINNEYDLAVSRGIGSFISMADCAGICALENLKNYTFGNGFAYDVINKDKNDDQMNLLDVCNDVINEFIERVDWGLREPELGEYGHGKGEFIHVLRPIGGGFAKSKIYQPAYLTEPSDVRWASDQLGYPLLDWSFGVGTVWGDSEEILGYCFDAIGDHSSDEIVEPRFVEHMKMNVPLSVKRGMSDFYCCYVQMRQRAKVLDNTAEGTATQAAIAWIEENAAATTQQQAEQAMGARMDKNTLGAMQQAKYNNGSASTFRARRLNKGTVITVGQGKKYSAGPLGANSSGKEQATLVADAVGRYIGSRWQMPEFMFNNNAATANYASTFVAESPFVKGTQRRQYRYAIHFIRIIWRVLEIAIAGGRIPGVLTLSDLKQRVSIKYTPPTVESRDRSSETNRNKTLHDSGILSPKSWAEREDLNYDEEIDRGAISSAERMAELMPQLPQGSPKPGEPPVPGKGKAMESYP